MKNLTEKVNTIQTREDFVSFIHLLVQDLKDNPSGWENSDLGSFLNAMAAWVEDMDAYYQNQGLPMPDQPDWRLLGHILMAAKIYE